MADDVSAPLPDLDLKEQSILTVDTGDNNAVITQLVIHLSQDAPPEAVASLTPLLTFTPLSGGAL